MGSRQVASAVPRPYRPPSPFVPQNQYNVTAPTAGIGQTAIGTAGQLAIFFGMLLMFVRFAQFHEMLTYVMGVNIYLLYVVGPPAILCFALSGGMGRLLKNRCAIYCLAFGFFMIASTPFSSWRSDSLQQLYFFLKTNLIMVAIIGGLACGWRDVRRILSMAALGGALSVVNGKLFSMDFSGRAGLAFGTVANPDDYAVHLLLLTPFLVWMVLDSERSKILRLAALGVIGLAMELVIRTASRGALIALFVALAFFLWQTSVQRRIAVLVVIPLIAVMIVAFLPQQTMERLLSFSTTSATGEGISKEAAEASEMRKELLIKSIQVTFEHPIFGVGPAEFGNYEGMTSAEDGKRGLWHGTHNTYTEISSECGIPALFFYVAAIVSAFNLLRKTRREAQQRPENRDIATLVLCVMLSFVGFFTGITFLNFAYLFYMPTLVGLACAVTYGARGEMARRAMAEAASVQASPVPGFGRVGRVATAQRWPTEQRIVQRSYHNTP